MTAQVLEFLGGDLSRIAIYEAVEAAIRACGESELSVAKTQIAWGNPRKFAFLSLPRRAGQGGLVLTFGLEHRVEDPRINQVVEPYPDRWTHHVGLTGPADVDVTVRAWLSEAWMFARYKKRKR